MGTLPAPGRAGGEVARRLAARDRLAAAESPRQLRTLEELRGFFAACAAREAGREPDWDEHRRVIEQSIESGAPRGDLR